MSNLLVQNIKHTNNTTAQTIDTSGRTTVSIMNNDSTYRSDNGAVTQNLVKAVAKVLCNYTQVGTQTIKDSMNVTSLTDTNVGVTTVTFTNNFTDAFWIGGVYQNGANDTGSGSWNVSQSGYVARTSSSVQQTSFTGSALVDSGHVDIQNFGTLL